MASHFVKCLYCGKRFDTEQEPFVKPRSNRYAHKSCAEKAEEIDDGEIKEVDAKTLQENADKQRLKDYINELFGDKANWPVITKQIKEYVDKNNYTYSGIYKALKYFYEIKHGDKEKGNYALGIVPYIYENAFRYYYAIWEAQQTNQAILTQMPTYETPHKEIRIKVPERKQMGRKPLFTFLDEEE